MTTPIPFLFTPTFRAFDSAGNSLSGGLLYTYAANTLTPQITYSDALGTIPNTNPVVLDTTGSATVRLSSAAYKFVLKDAGGATQWTQDFYQASYLQQADIAILLNPQTAAEISASVTPVNFAYSELTFERYGGGVAASSTLNNTAMLAAIAVVTAKVGGGTLLIQGAGTYNFGANTYNIPTGMNIQGGGYQTILQYTGSGVFFGMPNSGSGGGRNLFQNFQMFGPGNGTSGVGNAGTGIQLGDNLGSTGIIMMRQILITRFATAMRIGGCIWGLFQMCEFGNAAGNTLGTSITNNVGIDFNMLAAGNQNNVLTFENCIISNNANAGVQATSVPLTQNCFQWINCNVQNNCQSATSNPQFYCGPISVMTIDNMYMEYVLGGTNPEAIRTDSWGRVDMRGFFVNGAATVLHDHGGGSMDNVRIHEFAFTNVTTAAVNCPSEDDVVIYNGSTAASVTLTGTGCHYIADGGGMASWKQDEAGFSPVMASAVGSITQAMTGTYSQVGNVLTFQISGTWSAIAGASGNVTFTGLPVAAKSGGQIAAVAIGSFNGITVPAQNQLTGQISANTTVITLLFSAAAFSNFTVAAMAAAGQICIQGSYQV